MRAWQDGTKAPIVSKVALDLLPVAGGKNAVKYNQFSNLTLGGFSHITVGTQT